MNINSQTKQKILLVDDAIANIEILNEALEDEYEVFFAISGEDSLAIIEKQFPDLVLLDVKMPEMDGYEVCVKLKANAITASIPVIFVTALSDTTDETQGFELGAVDYITKPITPAIVLSRVRTHLKIRQMQVQLEKQNQDLLQATKLRDDVERITRHDLKTPLTSIINIPRLIIESNKCDKEANDMLRIVERAGRKMLDMINRSLDLYKMEVGAYQACLQPINVMPILWSALRETTADPVASKKQWRVLRIGNPMHHTEEIWANAEEMLCYSMFANLLKNAFEASPPGESIDIDVNDLDPAMLRISISNLGAVPEEIREHFFEKYVTSGKKGGTGLGTYSARLCAETQKGSIALESSGEVRTTVIVSLPRQKPMSAAELEAFIKLGFTR